MAKKAKTNEDGTPIVINNTSGVIGWLNGILKMIKEYGVSKIIIGSILLAIVSFFFYFMFNPSKIFEVYDGWKARQHDHLTELRQENSPRMQSIIDKLTFHVDASRTIILELHNGTTGSGGLPFNKCTATFEGLNIEVMPVAEQYKDVSLSLMPFAQYLFKEGYWNGSTDSLMNIDRGLAYKMKSNQTEYFAACIIEGIEKPLAIMVVSFPTPSLEVMSPDELRENVRHVAMEVSVLLEVEQQIGKLKK